MNGSLDKSLFCFVLSSAFVDPKTKQKKAFFRNCFYRFSFPRNEMLQQRQVYKHGKQLKN